MKPVHLQHGFKHRPHNRSHNAYKALEALLLTLVIQAELYILLIQLHPLKWDSCGRLSST